MKTEKPTREERLKAYEYAREWLAEKMIDDTGICVLLKNAGNLESIRLDDYPEFMEVKPSDKKYFDYWFGSAKERIQVLTKIINKMKEEGLIKPGQQFKIDSIEELKEAYEKLKSQWSDIFSLRQETDNFECKGYNWVICDEGTVHLYDKQYAFETIPNPFKKDLDEIRKEYHESVQERLKVSKKLLNLINEQLSDPIREELKALREEVEKLKGYRVFNGKGDFVQVNIPESELERIQEECRKRSKEEKPKESPDLKIKWNHCELSIEPWHWTQGKTVSLKLIDGRDIASIPIEKPDAIKIVNYLKKHFEI